MDYFCKLYILENPIRSNHINEDLESVVTRTTCAKPFRKTIRMLYYQNTDQATLTLHSQFVFPRPFLLKTFSIEIDTHFLEKGMEFVEDMGLIINSLSIVRKNWLINTTAESLLLCIFSTCPLSWNSVLGKQNFFQLSKIKGEMLRHANTTISFIHTHAHHHNNNNNNKWCHKLPF